MIELPEMLYSDGIRKCRQIKFGGYQHTLPAGEGEIWDMGNMSGEHYPVLSSRRPRYLLEKLEKPNGIYSHDVLLWVDGTELYADGVCVGSVADSAKSWVSIGRKVVILPDKACYDVDSGELSWLEAAFTGAVKLMDGTYAGVEAAANTVYGAGADWGSRFRVGDAVTISGCVTHTANNKTPVIREIDGDYLRFYENTFTISDGGDPETVTICREVPELDHICAHENRLWGCRGSTIYASKLGDPGNWNVFDGLSDDSYALEVAGAGEFTGCCSYRGYATFFKEDKLFKIYGDKPSNFQLLDSASTGVAAGCGKSLAVAGETLFFLSRAGVMAYTGGVPQLISECFGTERYGSGVAGSDGVRYFLSVTDREGAASLFVYDCGSGLWHREDDLRAVGFAWAEGLRILGSDGQIRMDPRMAAAPEGSVTEEGLSSWAEFGDITEDDPNKKGVSKLQVRAELEEGATLELQIQYDSDGVWRRVKALAANRKRSYYLPVVPRRCDHFRIRLLGTGQWRLYSLVRESYSGSEL